jgi:response regulator of citrate/malate metabolism
MKVNGDFSAAPVNYEFIQYLEFCLSKLENSQRNKVLIIEDDLFSFHTLKRLFKDFDSNITCLYAANSWQALLVLESTHCDLVIADFYLEGKENGLEICQVLLEKFPHLKTAVVSSMKKEEFQHQNKSEKYFINFFQKPIYPKKLWNFIRNHFYLN